MLSHKCQGRKGGIKNRYRKRCHFEGTEAISLYSKTCTLRLPRNDVLKKSVESQYLFLREQKTLAFLCLMRYLEE